MKKTTLSVILIIAANTLFSQWIQQSSGTTEDLNSVCFTDSLDGWATGNFGVILHTSDGGENWEEQTSEITHHLTDIHFTDSLNGWTVGKNSGIPSFGHIYNTSDGGSEWKEIGFMLSSSACGVYFTDTLNGWLADGILHTSDGGETWETQNGIYFRYGDIYFTDSLNGWITGSSVSPSSGIVHSIILHTNNGGNTWEYQFDISSMSAPFLYSVYFADTMKGWIAGGYPWLFDIILKTTDGGNNWDTSYFSNSGTLYSVNFADGFNGWAVGYNGTILYTSNGGNTWETIPSNTEHTLKSVYFTENGLGWIVGGGGTILQADYSQIIGLDESSEDQSKKLDIRCYPNPICSSTTIEFESTQTEFTELTICNQLGELIETIYTTSQAGKQSFIWDSSGLPSGVYFIRIQFDKDLITRKLIKL